MLCQGRTLITS